MDFMIYILASLALILKPGPDIMFTIATALSTGKRDALVLMLGLLSGCYFWVLLLSLGAATFFVNHPELVRAMCVMGALYIAYLAFGTLIEAYKGFRSKDGIRMEGGSGLTGWRIFMRGIIMSTSNPLTIMFFMAFFPKFIRADSFFPPMVQSLFLGLVFVGLVPLIYVPEILLADGFRKIVMRSKKFMPILKLVSGFTLAIIAAMLICLGRN